MLLNPLPDNLERREIARAEMSTRANVGKFMYLLHSPYIRKVPLGGDLVAHSAVDATNILWDVRHTDATDFEPRIQWQNVKRRMLKNDPGMYQYLKHIPFPLWNDSQGRVRKGDALTTGGLFLLIMDLRSPLSNEIRHYIANLFERIPIEFRDKVLLEMERDSGWAGTQNHLLIAPHVNPDTYENPKEPPGSPKESPTLWKPKG